MDLFVKCHLKLHIDITLLNYITCTQTTHAVINSHTHCH